MKVWESGWAGVFSNSQSGTPVLHGNQPLLELTGSSRVGARGGRQHKAPNRLALLWSGVDVLSAWSTRNQGMCGYAVPSHKDCFVDSSETPPQPEVTSRSFSLRLLTPLRGLLCRITLEGVLGHLFYKFQVVYLAPHFVKKGGTLGLYHSVLSV